MEGGRRREEKYLKEGTEEKRQKERGLRKATKRQGDEKSRK